MRRSAVVWVAIIAATVALGCSKSDSAKPISSESAARPGAIGTGGAGADVRSDDDFVRDLGAKNMAQIELSRLAMDKSTDPRIKVFAQQLIADHEAAGAKLKSIAAGQRIEWPAQPEEKQRKAASELAKKQGAELDRDYLAAVIEGHQDYAAKLESRLDVQSLSDWKTAAAATAKSTGPASPNTAMQVRPDSSGTEATRNINQWAADTYPVAQKHLDTARELEKVLKER